MFTREVVGAHRGLEEPLFDEGLTPVKLGKILRSFGVQPRVARKGQATARGYHSDELEPVWSRYLS